MPSIRARAPTRRVAGGADRRRADAAAPAKPTDGATLFKQQCATCHFTNYPSRFGKVRRCSGSSAGRPARWTASTIRPFAKADFVWDDARLDAWLANPQAIIPGAIMAYRQPKAETRAAIIAYLKELN